MTTAQDSRQPTLDQRISRIGEIMAEATELRGKLRANHPGFDTLPGEEQERLWREMLGLPSPMVPSLKDKYEDASCLRCKDTGWLTKQKNNYIQEAIPCPACGGWEEEKKQYALAQSGIPNARKMCNFESFIPVKFPKSIKAEERKWKEEYFNSMVESVHDLATGTANFYLLFLYGGTGNGKTHLAHAAGLEAIARGLRVKFWYVPEMFGKIRAAMDTEGQSADDLIDEIKRCEFLILDDMGVREETKWQHATLEEIINHRYAEGLPLIATTNRDPKGLGTAILSRFKDQAVSRMFVNEAPDYRRNRGK